MGDVFPNSIIVARLEERLTWALLPSCTSVQALVKKWKDNTEKPRSIGEVTVRINSTIESNFSLYAIEGDIVPLMVRSTSADAQITITIGNDSQTYAARSDKDAEKQSTIRCFRNFSGQADLSIASNEQSFSVSLVLHPYHGPQTEFLPREESMPFSPNLVIGDIKRSATGLQRGRYAEALSQGKTAQFLLEVKQSIAPSVLAQSLRYIYVYHHQGNNLGNAVALEGDGDAEEANLLLIPLLFLNDDFRTIVDYLVNTMQDKLDTPSSPAIQKIAAALHLFVAHRYARYTALDKAGLDDVHDDIEKLLTYDIMEEVLYRDSLFEEIMVNHLCNQAAMSDGQLSIAVRPLIGIRPFDRIGLIGGLNSLVPHTPKPSQVAPSFPVRFDYVVKGNADCDLDTLTSDDAIYQAIDDHLGTARARLVRTVFNEALETVLESSRQASPSPDQLIHAIVDHLGNAGHK